MQEDLRALECDLLSQRNALLAYAQKLEVELGRNGGLMRVRTLCRVCRSRVIH